MGPGSRQVSSRAVRRASLLAVAVLASGLSVTGACGPSIDPAAQADLEKHLSQIQTSEETYPPAEAYSPMAFNVGQWTQYRLTDERGRKSLVTSKLVGQEAGAYWFETVTETPYGRDITKMLVAMPTGRDPAGMEIRELRVKNKQGQPVTVDLGADAQARAKSRAALDLLAVPVDGEEKDDVRVPGGHFIGCYIVETQGAWGPWPTATDVCTHPSVPLSGVVRARPSGKGGLLELVAFGVTGADSEL